MIMTEKMELLAPAGGKQELIAAVDSGADAVYIGAEKFSARAGAGNFDERQMREAVEYAHAFGVKVHCAINTLIKENELMLATETAISASKCGVDALIIQDIGFASHLRKVLPDMELHASTQMTVTSAEGVAYLKDMGFTRVVLARELSVSEIERIVKSTDIEIEVFVHGAICMSYSGQCLMSSMLGGRSGNRGRCAQPCRLKYDLMENDRVCDSAYVLSPKDMALVNHLTELKRIGVTSLKIEGRLKSAEYVSCVGGIYRKYIDKMVPITTKDMTELKNAFSRSGFTDGYFTSKFGAGMMSHKNPANNSGSIYTQSVKDTAAGKNGRKIPINIYATLKAGEVFKITACDGDGNYAKSEGEVSAEYAVGRPLDEERIKIQLAKLGTTVFVAETTEVEVDANVTVPIKEINEVRRKVCESLWEKRISRKEKRVCSVQTDETKKSQKGVPYLTAEIMTKEQGEAALKTGRIKRLFAPPGVAKLLDGENEVTEIVTRMPDILSDVEPETESVSVSSPAAVYKYKNKAKYGEFRLNIYNSLSAKNFSDLKCITLSPELNLNEIRYVADKVSQPETEIIGYGHIPLMLMKNCPIKAMGKCQKGKRIYSLRDRKNVKFPIMCSFGCRAVLLNSKPIYMADMADELIKTNVDCIRLNFTLESPEECTEIINMYSDALDGRKVPKMKENTFTRGHLHRGVQ